VYQFSVWAKDANSNGRYGNSLGRWDAYTAISYTLTAAACSGVTAQAAPPSPSAPGTTVVITGSASGCPNPTYEFWMLPPGSSTWQLAQPYSTSAVFDWKTTGAAAGTYHFSVWAKDAASPGTYGNMLGRWDAYAAISYALATPCSSVTATSAPPSTAARGTTVTITGVATGCPNPQYEFWMLAPGSSTWQQAQAYSATATFSWSTTGKAAGAYHFSVWARDATSSGSSGDSLGRWDAYVGLAYTLT
jgi:hypothetical protein